METPVNTILLELIRELMKTIVLCELEKEDTDLSHAGYNNQRVLISSLFKGDYNTGQIILRLTVIDSLYSTNAAYSYFSTEEMAEKIRQLGSQSEARDYFYKVARGEKDDQHLFSEHYGFQKNLSEGSKQMSLLSKYAFYELLQEPEKYPIGFPIYDRLAKEAYPLVRKMLDATDYYSMPDNASLSIEQYIQCLTQLRKVLFTGDSLFKPKEAKNAFQQFDILDAYLWRMGKFSEGNLSLLLKREDYEKFIVNIGLAAPKEEGKKNEKENEAYTKRLKEDFAQRFPNQKYNFSKLILSHLQSDENPFAQLTNEKYMNALLQHWRVFEGYRNIAQK